ncbi:MAG: alanine racemase [Oscillospiraceae bacterium]|nr:alanine racemase [Oscillospiraceae bacterium]
MKKLVIDRKAMRINLQTVKDKSGSAEIFADLSANAYGMGLLETAHLMRDGGVTAFAVSDVRDAAALRENGFTDERIMMLRSTADAVELSQLLDLGVICTVGSHDAAVTINGIAESKSTVCEVQIKIDVGLGRYGFAPDELEKITSIYRYMANLAVVGVFSTFSASWRGRKRMETEFAAFRRVLDELHKQGFETGVSHICDSAALFAYEESRMDAVRVGTAISGRVPGQSIPGLLKVGYIEAGIEEVGWFPKGRTVDSVTLRKPAKLAVVSVGYFHGFGLRRREADWRFLDLLKNRRSHTFVRIGNQKARVIGGIGLMHTIIDVTSIECSAGDSVVMDVDPVCVKGLPTEYIN